MNQIKAIRYMLHLTQTALAEGIGCAVQQSHLAADGAEDRGYVATGLVERNAGLTERFALQHVLFETISAVSTAGLSCGTTTEALSPVGRAVIMVCMFCGRLGALAVVFLIGGRETAPSRIRFPKEDLVVG